MDWLSVLEILLILPALLAFALVAFAARRRWLGRASAIFECSVRLRTTTPGAGWALGLGRYSGERIEWFRLFSFTLRPRMSFRRDTLRVVGHHRPDPVDAVSLYEDQIVVRVESSGPNETRQWDLAMPTDSLTAMLAWLEAAPPGRPYPI